MKKEYNFWVYILTNWKKNVLYIGVTNNLGRRLTEHYGNRGTSASFTGKFYCYNLVYYEWHQYVLEAIAREKELKKWSRERKVALIEAQNPEWKFFNTVFCEQWPPEASP